MNECINYEANMVWNQTPLFGEKVFKDEGIKLFVSKGEFAPELYDVPILIDLNLEEAGIKQVILPLIDQEPCRKPSAAGVTWCYMVSHGVT